jgi:hypothetical protein
VGVVAAIAGRGPSAVAAGLATFAKLAAERLVWSTVERSRALLDQSRDPDQYALALTGI